MPEHDTDFFAGAEAFTTWLEQHGATADVIWIRMAKKHTGVESLDWVRAVEVALCFGWIDGQSRRLDDDWFVQKFTPRRARSLWSKVNRLKVEALVAAGRMREPGLAEVARAKADGRWDSAYDGMATMEIPPDLAHALATRGLTADFAALSSTGRYSILHPIQTAKQPETRARRIAKHVDALATTRTAQD